MYAAEPVCLNFAQFSAKFFFATRHGESTYQEVKNLLHAQRVVVSLLVLKFFRTLLPYNTAEPVCLNFAQFSAKFFFATRHGESTYQD